MVLTENDRTHIRELLRAATTPSVSLCEIDEVVRNVRGARTAAVERLGNIQLESRHVVAYDIILEKPMHMEHLSISHPNKLTEPDVLTIAAEFGLGDKATWTMFMPPVPPMRAYHILRTIAPTGGAS